ncbi:NAD(P)H-dependent flavin oxidoreductase [Alicycliphilus sp. T452]|jgi:nitronate monooxygenase
MWSTRLSRLFGIRLPIFAGGLMWLSDARYVAAVVRAGGIAFMTPRSFASESEYERQLVMCAQFCEGLPFGVNLTASQRDSANMVLQRQLDIALSAGVRHFETVGPASLGLFERIHDAGGTLIHKVGFVDHAIKAEQHGADAVAIVGMEAGGHPGMHEQSSFLSCACALDELSVPLALGGGIGHGRQIAAALVLGCDGVVVGTRFLACDEIGTHAAVKARIVQSGSHESVQVLRSVKHPWRVLHNRTAKQVLHLEANGVANHEEFGELIKGSLGKTAAYDGGDADTGLLSLGQSVGFVRQREPVAATMAQLVQEAELRWYAQFRQNEDCA